MIHSPRLLSYETSEEDYACGGALLNMALSLLQDPAGPPITLAGVAAAAGISDEAAQRVFGGDSEFLDAVVYEGGRMLAEVQGKAALGEASDEDRSRACTRAYVRFALARPRLFQLVQARRAVPFDAVAFAKKVRKQPADESFIRTMRFAALGLGLASMVLNDASPFTEEDIDRIITSAT